MNIEHPIFEHQMLNEINRVRREHGIVALRKQNFRRILEGCVNGSRYENGLPTIRVWTHKTSGTRRSFYTFAEYFTPEAIERLALDTEVSRANELYRENAVRMSANTNFLGTIQKNIESARVAAEQEINDSGLMIDAMNRIDVNRIVEVLSNTRRCPSCLGKGCLECIGGIMPSTHPKYMSGQLIKLYDVVSVPHIDAAPQAAYAQVIGWEHQGDVIDLYLLDEFKKPLDMKANFLSSEIKLVQRVRTG